MDSPRSTSRSDPRSSAVQRRRISRIPAFTPVPLRPRADGWVPWRQAEFLGLLAQTRCVKKAAALVGMSRESAYRLRRKPGAELFAAAWDTILGAPGTTHASPAKVTLESLLHRIEQGSFRPIMRDGRYAGTIRKPDNRALLSALTRLDRIVPPGEDGGAGPEGHKK